MVTSGSRSAYSTTASAAAARALGRLSAATANSGWPMKLTTPSANIGSSPENGLMSFLPGTSSGVSTQTTPGAARTAARSIDHPRVRPRAWPT
jgi:hypothetical protein